MTSLIRLNRDWKLLLRMFLLVQVTCRLKYCPETNLSMHKIVKTLKVSRKNVAKVLKWFWAHQMVGCIKFSYLIAELLPLFYLSKINYTKTTLSFQKYR